MRFMMLMYPGPNADTTTTPDPKEMAAMGRYNDELRKAGVLLAVDGLRNSDKGVRVRFAEGKPVVSDGPFTESKEIVGGYWMLEVTSKEEAVAWARKVPVAGPEMVELRQVAEMSDFSVDEKQTTPNP